MLKRDARIDGETCLKGLWTENDVHLTHTLQVTPRDFIMARNFDWIYCWYRAAHNVKKPETTKVCACIEIDMTQVTFEKTPLYCEIRHWIQFYELRSNYKVMCRCSNETLTSVLARDSKDRHHNFRASACYTDRCVLVQSRMSSLQVIATAVQWRVSWWQIFPDERMRETTVKISATPDICRTRHRNRVIGERTCYGSQRVLPIYWHAGNKLVLWSPTYFNREREHRRGRRQMIDKAIARR
jgi:hypothetical protein